MTDVRKTSRHQRLRTALRENLKRRKAQARVLAADGGDPAARAAEPLRMDEAKSNGSSRPTSDDTQADS
jgi:hypothetical protein